MKAMRKYVFIKINRIVFEINIKIYVLVYSYSNQQERREIKCVLNVCYVLFRLCVKFLILVLVVNSWNYFKGGFLYEYI